MAYGCSGRDRIAEAGHNRDPQLTPWGINTRPRQLSPPGPLSISANAWVRTFHLAPRT